MSNLQDHGQGAADHHDGHDVLKHDEHLAEPHFHLHAEGAMYHVDRLSAGDDYGRNDARQHAHHHDKRDGHEDVAQCEQCRLLHGGVKQLCCVG